MARLLFLSSRSGGGVDGIADHTERLCDAVNGLAGAEADTVDLAQAQTLAPAESAAMRFRPDVVVVQFNPYSFSRFGLPRWLPRALDRFKHRMPGTRIALLAHELWLPLNADRTVGVALAQRVVLRAVAARADALLASTESFAASLSRIAGRRHVAVLPVGSNVPDLRAGRAEQRCRWNVAGDGFVVAAFGTGHPSRQLRHVSAAMERLLHADPAAVALNLGAGAPALTFDGVAPERAFSPGALPSDDVSRAIAATDLMLLPFVDGLSTRRTTLMASFQHDIAVLGTHGINTDAALRLGLQGALLPAESTPEAFADAAQRLASSSTERRAVAEAGARLYRERYSWPAIAERLIDEVTSQTG